MITFYNVIYRLAVIQIASDAGKYIFRDELINLVFEKDSELAIKQKYKRKGESLKTLIGYLSRNKVNGISFHINSVNNHENMVIIYFNIKYKGVRYQVSFHSPYDKNFSRMADRSRTSWICSTIGGKKRKGVLDSAETLIYLLKNIKESE